VELGHQRIAYLIAPHEPVHTRRLAAYQNALRENGVTPNPRWVRHLRDVAHYPTRFVGAANARMAQWLEEDWKALDCTAILCQNDQTALGTLEALSTHGMRVPQDVSVIGFDGTEAADYARPRLTTIRVPLYEIGARGVELLLQTGRADQDASTLVLPTTLQIGESTAPSEKLRKKLNRKIELERRNK
jgi:LacI family transcriptional regulator